MLRGRDEEREVLSPEFGRPALGSILQDQREGDAAHRGHVGEHLGDRAAVGVVALDEFGPLGQPVRGTVAHESERVGDHGCRAQRGQEARQLYVGGIDDSRILAV